MFHLDAKNEEKVKNALKISLALPEYLLANASRQVEFYIPAVEIFTQSASLKKQHRNQITIIGSTESVSQTGMYGLQI